METAIKLDIDLCATIKRDLDLLGYRAPRVARRPSGDDDEVVLTVT
jgi:hypothetical protein